MLIVDQYESGTHRTDAVVEEVDVFYSQVNFLFLSSFLSLFKKKILFGIGMTIYYFSLSHPSGAIAAGHIILRQLAVVTMVRWRPFELNARAKNHDGSCV